MRCVLTRDTCSNHRHWFHAEVFTQGEVFVVSKSAYLMIASDVTQGASGIERSYRSLPVVDVVDTVTMYDAIFYRTVS